MPRSSRSVGRAGAVGAGCIEAHSKICACAIMRCMLAHARFAIVLAVLFTVDARSYARSEKAPMISDAASLDRYLAQTPAARSPFERLSPPAKRRFISSVRAGHYDFSDIATELTHAEAVDLLALFGLEAYVPAHMPAVHHAIGASETPAMSAAFDRLDAASFAGERDAVVADYRRDFAPRQNGAQLHAMSDGDVALVLRASTTAAFADADAIDPAVLMRDVEELDRRKAAAPFWIRSVYLRLLSRRDFVDARAFRAAHGDAELSPVPTIRDAASDHDRTVLQPDLDGGGLTRRAVTVDPKAQVLVVSGCHYSKDAALGIESDPQLRAAFSHHVLWIMPSSEDVTDPDFAQWNRAHPLAAMSAVYRESEWPMIDSWAMPTFYFLRDGAVIEKVAGWPGNREAILDGFRKLGLAP